MSIPIITCFLDTLNQTEIGTGSLGDMLSRTGKKHLWEERTGDVIDTVVLHYMSAVEILPERPFERGALLGIFQEYGVSSHYLVERDGTVLRLVPEQNRAWHCGGSIMPVPDSRTGVNDFSIGIELAATPESGFTAEQYNSLSELCSTIEDRYPEIQYVGHEDVAGMRAVELGLRSDPKVDPGPLFNWSRFRAQLIDRREEKQSLG